VSAIAPLSPDAFGDDALVFPGEEGGFLDPHNFRARVFRKLVERELGKGRDFTPHGLRHTFASLHLARGSNLKWIQAMGGWASAKLLLDLYGHHLRTENAGYADVLSQAPKQVPIASTPRGTDPLTDPRASARPLATNMPPECRAKSRRSARGCAGAPGGNRTPTGMKSQHSNYNEINQLATARTATKSRTTDGQQNGAVLTDPILIPRVVALADCRKRCRSNATRRAQGMAASAP